MEVIDYDDANGFPHDFIDAFSIDIPSNTVKGSGPILSNTSGQHGLGFISLTARMVCAQFFYGERCRYINVCARDAIQCSGHGVCVPEMNSSSCSCDHGYTGEGCEVTDYCLEQACNMRGVCMNGKSSHSCACDPGYTDRDCETDINECVGQNCSGNGQCVDGENNFTCLCQPGFTGDLCSAAMQGKNICRMLT